MSEGVHLDPFPPRDATHLPEKFVDPGGWHRDVLPEAGPQLLVHHDSALAAEVPEPVGVGEDLNGAPYPDSGEGRPDPSGTCIGLPLPARLDLQQQQRGASRPRCGPRGCEASRRVSVQVLDRRETRPRGLGQAHGQPAQAHPGGKRDDEASAHRR